MELQDRGRRKTYLGLNPEDCKDDKKSQMSTLGSYIKCKLRKSRQTSQPEKFQYSKSLHATEFSKRKLQCLLFFCFLNISVTQFRTGNLTNLAPKLVYYQYSKDVHVPLITRYSPGKKRKESGLPGSTDFRVFLIPQRKHLRLQ